MKRSEINKALKELEAMCAKYKSYQLFRYNRPCRRSAKRFGVGRGSNKLYQLPKFSMKGKPDSAQGVLNVLILETIDVSVPHKAVTLYSYFVA